MSRDGTPLALTRAEYEIVEFLWRQRGKVQSKKRIADSYQRDPASEASANSVEGLIGRIKRKLDPDNVEFGFWTGVALAGAGRLEEAGRWLRQAYASDPSWLILARRLVPLGLLPDDPSLIEPRGS